MNKLPVLVDFDYDKIGSFREGNPFEIAFCYTSPKYYRLESFIIKGGANDVRRQLEAMRIPMVVFRTFWRHGRHRKLSADFVNFKNWTLTGETPHAIPRDRRIDKHKPCYFYRRTEVRFAQRIWLTFRRFPRKWLSEYDQMIEYRYPVAQIHP